MPCCGDREKIGQMKLEEKWDYINLNDFKSSSCFTGFSYVMVWVFGTISIAVYAVDTFTAVNLLAFNKWSSQIQPKIPLSISRWIFAGAIIASFVLLAYRWFKAIRVMRSGGIAESYLDPLAVRVQSVRIGKHKGYRRFLLFAELTKSKKGADYVALFSYFSFEAWMRIIFADGPRQVINAITLYSVMELDLIPTGSNAAPSGTSPVLQFFINIKALAEKNYQQAVVLFGMLFTLIVWVIAALSLLVSVILYLIFLWHHIPTMDGSLKRFCRRKINTRLERIVRKKTAAALAKGGLQLKDRTPTMPLAEGEELKPVKVVPTLPSVNEYPEDKKPIVTVTPLSRQPTQSTLPPYSSEPGYGEPQHEEDSFPQPRLPEIEDESRPWLTRTNTQNSAYGESASLTGGAAPMGYSPLDNSYAQPNVPPMPPAPYYNNQARPYSPSPSMNRPPTAQGRPGPSGPMPMEGFGRRTPGPGYSQTPPPPMGRQTPGFARGGPPERSYTPATNMPPERSYTAPATNLPPERSYTPAMNPPFDRQQTPQGNMREIRTESPARFMPPGRSFTTPAPSSLPSTVDPANRSHTPGDRTASPRPPNQGNYVAFNPYSSSTNADPDVRSQSPLSTRSQPIPRPSTAAPSHNPIFESHPGNVRAATTTPSNGYVRRGYPPHQPQRSHQPVHEQDYDDEYDPLSYYGSAA